MDGSRVVKAVWFLVLRGYRRSPAEDSVGYCPAGGSCASVKFDRDWGVRGVAMSLLDGSRSTLEEMLDSMRGEEVEDRDSTSGEESSQDDLLQPLPLRPTSRARLPSSMRAKKALGACLDNLAVPGSKGSSALLKENIALESPIANLIVVADPAAAKCLPRQLADLAPGNGHDQGYTPLAERETVANNGSFASPPFVTSPSVITPARSREPEGGSLTQLPNSETRKNFAERINDAADQPSFSFLTVQESPAPHTPAPPVAENLALPATTPSSGGKKWKDDGTLRLKKVLKNVYPSCQLKLISVLISCLEYGSMPRITLN